MMHGVVESLSCSQRDVWSGPSGDYTLPILAYSVHYTDKGNNFNALDISYG